MAWMVNVLHIFLMKCPTNVDIYCIKKGLSESFNVGAKVFASTQYGTSKA